MKLFEKFKGAKMGHKKVLIIALLVVVIISIFLSSFPSKTSVSTKTKSNTTQSLYQAYLDDTESRLINVLNSVRGISNVKVFLNISQSPKITYLTEQKNSSTQASSQIALNTIVLAKDGTLTFPIVTLEELPEILGVLIVAKGAGDVTKKMQITNVVSSVLNVNISSVEVLEGK